MAIIESGWRIMMASGVFQWINFRSGSVWNPETPRHIAIVGAGGKTTLAYRLVQQALRESRMVVFTTSTHIWMPAPGQFDDGVVTADPVGALSARTAQSPARSVWLAGSDSGAPQGTPADIPPTPAAGHMAVIGRKLKGYSPPQLDALWVWMQRADPRAMLVVEADGARSKVIKAPAPYEPQIPASATVVMVVASMECLGRTADDAAHRPERVLALTGLSPGEPIASRHVIALLSHQEGGLARIPMGAHKVAVLTATTPEMLHDARAMAGPLLAAYDAVAAVLH